VLDALSLVVPPISGVPEIGILMPKSATADVGWGASTILSATPYRYYESNEVGGSGNQAVTRELSFGGTAAQPQRTTLQGRASMRLEYIFDFPSPYAYLASTQLRKPTAEVEYIPIDILTVMKVVNNQPTPACPAKLRYAAVDAGRWAARYGVPFEINRALLDAARDGAFKWQLLTRGAIVAQDAGLMTEYIAAIFRAVWAAPADLMSDEGRRAVLWDAEIDIPDLWERASTAETEARLDANNRVAAERGVFGVPTFFVGGEQFFGNDRLDMALARLNGSALRLVVRH
jgi:2-hydroxychromene-2-carboxylate isomerase